MPAIAKYAKARPGSQPFVRGAHLHRLIHRPSSILELRAKARRLKRDRESNLGLIVIDYLQLMRGHERADSREQEISGISSLAQGPGQGAETCRRRTVAAQSTGSNPRGDKKPVMADLRESGAIEQDADVIAFLYRPIVYDKTAEERAAEVIIAKQRNGPIDTVPLTFMSEYTRFENRAPEEVHYPGGDDL